MLTISSKRGRIKMQYIVIRTKKAREDFEQLSPSQQNAVAKDYALIEEKGIEFVKRRFLEGAVFEIKTGEVRSLFKFEENRIIIIGLIYVKKTQKIPKHVLKLAKKRLGELL